MLDLLATYPRNFQEPGALVLLPRRDVCGFDIRSGLAVAGATPGLFAVWHSGDPDQAVRAPSSAAEVTATGRGVVIAVRSSVLPYPAGATVAMLAKGRIWVVVEEAVTPASPVFVRFAAGAGGTVLGSFRASADTATAAQLARSRYVTSAVAGTLVQLSIAGV